MAELWAGRLIPYGANRKRGHRDRGGHKQNRPGGDLRLEARFTHDLAEGTRIARRNLAERSQEHGDRGLKMLEPRHVRRISA